MKKYIWENLYEANSPENYQRTYDLVNSVSVKKVGNNMFEIYYDLKKIYAHEMSKGEWNQNMSVYSQDMSTMLPIFVERGTSGSLYDREPLGAMQNTLDDKKSIIYALQGLTLFLKKQGYNAAIVG